VIEDIALFVASKKKSNVKSNVKLKLNILNKNNFEKTCER